MAVAQQDPWLTLVRSRGRDGVPCCPHTQELDRLHNEARTHALQQFAQVALGSSASDAKAELKVRRLS